MQVWFQRRRAKDRKQADDAKLQQMLAERRAAEAEGTGDAAAGSAAAAPAAAPEATGDAAAAPGAAGDAAAAPAPPSAAADPAAATPTTAAPALATAPSTDDPAVDDKGLYGQWLEFAALLTKARALLPEPYREDGPRLGFEFDPVPTAAEREAHKRKRLMLDGFEAEVEDDGEVQIRKRRLGEAGTVARLVRAMDGDVELAGVGDLSKVC